MLHVIRSGKAPASDEVLRAMFAARKSVFVDLLRWDVPVVDGRYERDQYDDEHATYLVLADAGGRHLGSARLLRTDRPHILGSHYPELCAAGVPAGAAIREVTRFCLDRRLSAIERRRVRDTLVTALAGAGKWLFVLGEVVTIFLLLANTVSAGRRRWQGRWLEAREVAELLRVCLMLRSVGIGRGIADPGQGGLLGWYAGAFARAAPLAHLDLSDSTAAAAPLVLEIRAQAQWNEATARRMHVAARRIERFGEVLFAAVLVAAIGWLLLDLSATQVASAVRYELTAITAGLPAIATAAYGIRVILDFEGIAQRTGRIGSGLDVSLAHWAEGTPSAARLKEFARNAADIMLGDIAAWRLLTEGRRLTIPG